MIAILTQKIEKGGEKKNFGSDRENKGPFITSEQSQFWRSFFFSVVLYNKKAFFVPASKANIPSYASSLF
jgi:hypothetical protein